ncbi:MAG TPA: SLC13 family permease [Trebonia sp.]|nr:SLC13 family permease [Trebonia sp.]
MQAAGEAVAVAALVAVLAWAVRRPRGWPEAVVAVPAALLVAAVRAVSLSAALAEARRLAPVVGFLACVLVLAKLCDDDGLFRYLGTWLSGTKAHKAPVAAAGGANEPGRGAGRAGAAGRGGRSGAAGLLLRVFAVAGVTTAVLSLDATVVLLTPVVLIAAGRLRVRARPHAYACGHLANSASLLLPVSNLTNLLAFTLSGLSFGRFAALMALPWLAAIGVEYVVIRWFFRKDLAGTGEVEHGTVRDESAGSGADPGSGRPAEAAHVPVFSLAVVAATLAGFVVASAAGANPAWAALGGAAVLAVRALKRGVTSPAAIAACADVPVLAFVIALGIVVTAVVGNGLGAALRPALPSGSSLPALLAVAGLAAVLAAAVNNLPAVLVLLPLAASPGTGASGAGAVLAVLIGVNVGPNLTYPGSLATLLWRRVLGAHGQEVPLGEFTRLGVATVIPALVLAVLALWLGLHG